MDALIFSCGTGGGHNSAANAIKQELLRRGHRVTMLDPYSLSNTRVGSLINQSYINLVKKAPRLFGLVYQLGNLYRRLPVHSPVYHINHRMALPVQRFLEEGNFDLIIMPHIFPGEILTNMRDHGICLPPTLLIATDYTCIPFTEEVQCDRYVIPSDDLCPAFTRWGIPKERLYPLGIPVDQSFENPLTSRKACAVWGLDPSLRYLLVVGGSMGAGGLMRVISILQKQYESSPDIRLIVICGSNQPLYRRLKERYGERLLLVQHTSQMAGLYESLRATHLQAGRAFLHRSRCLLHAAHPHQSHPRLREQKHGIFFLPRDEPCGSFAAKGAAACRRTAVAALFCPTDARVPAAKHLPPCCRAHL